MSYLTVIRSHDRKVAINYYYYYYTATGIHMPGGIAQCYLPSGRGDIPAFTPSRSWYSI